MNQPIKLRGFGPSDPLNPLHSKVKVFWKKLGGHVHCRVFVNGGKAGDLVFREEEWQWMTAYGFTHRVELVEEV